jgi:CheY-like chemotaxis protein
MATAKRILIVEDDAELREALIEQITPHDEFDAIGVETAKEAMQCVGAERVDMVLLDVGLPDMDGREACKLLRKHGFRSPIIILTGHDSDSDTILGLEAGAIASGLFLGLNERPCRLLRLIGSRREGRPAPAHGRKVPVRGPPQAGDRTDRVAGRASHR